MFWSENNYVEFTTTYRILRIYNHLQNIQLYIEKVDFYIG